MGGRYGWGKGVKGGLYTVWDKGEWGVKAGLGEGSGNHNVMSR